MNDDHKSILIMIILGLSVLILGEIFVPDQKAPVPKRLGTLKFEKKIIKKTIVDSNDIDYIHITPSGKVKVGVETGVLGIIWGPAGPEFTY